MKEFSFVIIPDLELGRPHFDLCDARIWNPTQRKERVVAGGIEERLDKTVGFINSLPEVKFAITVGDLTDSALPEQFLKVREILNKLEIPWIPVIGNHDLWPYRKLPDPFLSRRYLWEAPEGPIGPRIFEDLFRKNFHQLSESFDGWQKQDTSFQNYTFLHKGIRFIVIDNMSRRHAILGFPGVIGFPHLYLETRDWLRDQLSREEERKIIFSHSPLKRRLLRALSGNAKVVNIAGHWHKQSLRKSNDITTFVTGALYLKPVITVVEVLPDNTQFHSVRIP